LIILFTDNNKNKRRSK